METATPQADTQNVEADLMAAIEKLAAIIEAQQEELALSRRTAIPDFILKVTITALGALSAGSTLIAIAAAALQ
jgi:hypothetical protein